MVPLAALSLTGKESVAGPPSPSVTCAAAMESVGVASSSRIVPMPRAVLSVALTGALKAMTTVSSGSSPSSPFTVTATVLTVSPAAKVSAPPATVA